MITSGYIKGSLAALSLLTACTIGKKADLAPKQVEYIVERDNSRSVYDVSPDGRLLKRESCVLNNNDNNVRIILSDSITEAVFKCERELKEGQLIEIHTMVLPRVSKEAKKLQQELDDLKRKYP